VPFKNPQKTRCSCGGRSARMSSGRHGQVSLTCRPAVNSGARVGGACCTVRGTWPVGSGAAAHGSRGVCRSFSANPRAPFHPEAFDDACEIIGAPTVTQDQGDRDGLRISACREIAWVLAEEVIDAFVDVQLLDQEFQQARRPAKRLRSLNCRTDGFGPDVAAPTLVRGLRRASRSDGARFRPRPSGRDTTSIAVAGRWHGDPWRSGWRQPSLHGQCQLGPGTTTPGSCSLAGERAQQRTRLAMRQPRT